MSVGYLTDAFDLVNVRDLDLIAQAGARCGRLVLGVYTDDYAEQLLGRRPVVPLSERLDLLQHLRGVAEVVAHDEDSVVPADAVTFAAEDRDADLGDHVVGLRSARRTSSVILSAALAPLEHEAVA